MLAIATYVLISVISLTSAIIAHDAKRTVTDHIQGIEDVETDAPQNECVHDDGTPDEGKFI